MQNRNRTANFGSVFSVSIQYFFWFSAHPYYKLKIQKRDLCLKGRGGVRTEVGL
ncbi:hypothetical protein HanIR_Chr03g0142651 [Helianthus annuus]|nr:hypothetical protein HanIR_Chr03g0142651 [Helianthus annuus]